MLAVDLFAGAGGTSLGAKQAGINVVWAGNHNPVAVRYHKLNHPGIDTQCQDLHQADWGTLPRHDLLLASPCCQGHANAAGKAKKTKKADTSRSTAWAVVSCAEYHREDAILVENIPEFLKWELYPAWQLALQTLGYTHSPHIIDCANLGVPQHRTRLFIVATKSTAPLILSLPKLEHVPARSFIDLDTEGYNWDHISTRVAATQKRIENGRKKHGDMFLDAAYGSAVGGRSLDRPIGTIMTNNKHSVVKGQFIRPISIKEQAKAQTFPDDYIWPEGKTITKQMIGNAVPPRAANTILSALLEAA